MVSCDLKPSTLIWMYEVDFKPRLNTRLSFAVKDINDTCRDRAGINERAGAKRINLTMRSTQVLPTGSFGRRNLTE